MDRFVPRNDGRRAVPSLSSLRAKRGNLWIASILAMTGTTHGLLRSSQGRAKGDADFVVIASEARQSMDRFVPRNDGNKAWIVSCLAMTGATEEGG
jgi:hypothetical protein